MPKGLDNFKEHFKDYANNYVIIGGTACEVLLGELGFTNARATKDIDLVIVAEALTTDFVNKFWEYIKLGEYKHINKSTQKPQFYRFHNPANTSFPYMIELFSRIPDIIDLPSESNIIPIPADDDISSLSAILLDSSYYKLLVRGAKTIQGVTILDIPQIIAFKAKAWLDLTQKKNVGEHVNSKDIKKHRTDVLRLSAALTPNTQIKTDEQVVNDLNKFIDLALDDSINLKQLKINTDIETLKSRLMKLFYL